MKRLLIILLSVLSLTVVAQQPDWVNPILREELYPARAYYTGFASAIVSNGENKAVVYDRVRYNARVEAVASIQVTVEQTIERYIQNVQMNEDVSTKDIMISKAATRTSIKDIPGLKVEQWENPKTGEVYAFAWVKSANLYKQLMRRIVANNAKAEVEMESIEAMAERGDKMQAKNNLPKIQALIDDIENDQRIMLSIDANVTDEDMAVEETNSLKKRYQALAADLKNGIHIYMDCQADLFGQTYNALKGEIQGALSPMGCTFVSRADQSDWAIYITASAREYNKIGEGNDAQYYVYIDSKLSIDKTITGQRVYEEQLEPQKGGWSFSYVEAARRHGYKEVSRLLISRIKEQIQQ